MKKFIGRRDLLDDLDSLWRKRTSSLVACRGRRRIGKSTLFREFSRRTAECYIEIEGLAPEKNMTDQDQLDGFAASLARETQTPLLTLKNWTDAFFWLDHYIDDTKRTVVVLDEISWMGGYNPLFPSILRKAWERYFHRHDKLILVICGSVSAWIKENLLDSTGFAGRFSRDYVLPELSLDECVEFWGDAANRVPSREILDVLSVTGGVPRYLEEVDPGLDAAENIRRMCFMKSGQLFQDFDSIFNPLFGAENEVRKSILGALGAGPLTGEEISRRLGIPRNGHLSTNLRALCEGGFIADDVGINPETGKLGRVSKYRLKDNYTRFYLKYLAPHKHEITLGTYQYLSVENLPEWQTVMGLQFENLVVNNAMLLIPHLHIGGAIVESAAPYRNMRNGVAGKKAGCQIDLLIQTARTAYVIEIKRQKEIGPEIEDEVRRKIARLPLRSGVTPRPVLVYDGSLAPSVEGTGFFDAIIPVRKLLGI